MEFKIELIFTPLLLHSNLDCNSQIKKRNTDSKSLIRKYICQALHYRSVNDIA